MINSNDFQAARRVLDEQKIAKELFLPRSLLYLVSKSFITRLEDGDQALEAFI